MINCYQPFRTSEKQAIEFDRDVKKYKVNKSWLIRYYCELGRKYHDKEELLEAAQNDASSVPKLRKQS